MSVDHREAEIVPALDTVSRADADGPGAGADQPFAELGMTADEHGRVLEALGRRPTACELAMVSVMWSEHCSYKSSRIHLRRFAATLEGDAGRHVLAAPGANAGVVAVSDDLAVAFKVESHNHPSYVEPYQGAATGVGGIVRDVLAMGARPVAVMDSLRVGPLHAPDTRRVLPGVVAGVGAYGNCLGLANVGGEVVFGESYAGNPLVNALAVGVLPRARLQEAVASGRGNRLVLLGSPTGRDGIGGVSVLASATFDAGGGPAKRPAVQVGDPFTEKLLIEVCLELFDAGLVVGVQDLGGAGLTCALSETAAAGGVGLDVDLDAVHRRERLDAAEVLVSESQERMLAVVEPERLDAVLEVAQRWGCAATVTGEVTGTGRLRCTTVGEVVVDLPPELLADGPVYERPLERPAGLDVLQADRAEDLPRPADADLADVLLRLVRSEHLASRRWVVEQYDRYVRGGTALAWPHDAGVLRVDETTGAGVALALDGPGRQCRLDPYEGARLAVAEACRNVAATGAVPAAVSDCLNVGAPTDPGVMWTFAEVVRGIADACVELGLPVTGGNVSFYNATGATPVDPTPTVAVLGLIDDVERRVPSGVGVEGEALLLLGSTRVELSGSVWALVEHGHVGGLPPRVDLAAEKQLQEVLVAGSRDGMVSAAHDLSDGGLAQALVETCLLGGLGARVVLPAANPDGDVLDAATWLFSESAGRALVSVPRSEELRFTEMCDARGVPVARLGTVLGGDEPALEVQDLLRLPLRTLREAWETTLGGPPSTVDDSTILAVLVVVALVVLLLCGLAA